MGVANSSNKYILVDHINRDKSDNRKLNLRLVTYKENVVNVDNLKTNTSGHKGISWSKQRNKWEVYIHQDNKKVNLGVYSSIEKAIQVREMAEIIYFGETNPNYNNLIKKYINDATIQNYLLNNKKEE